MATIRPSINTNFSSRGNGTSQARQTVNKVSNIFSKKKVERRNILSRIFSYKKRRNEDERRKDSEQVLEAPNLAKANLFTPAKMIASATGGFFDRLLKVVGYLAAGWILRNLPTWIGMAQEFVARVNTAGKLISGFVSNVIGLFSGFGNVLTAIGKNIISFDFTDSNKNLSSAFGDLEKTINSMGSQLEETSKIFTTPLTEGKYSGKQIPKTGSEAPSTLYERPPSGPSGGGGGASSVASNTFSIIARGEGGYNSVNRGNAGDTPGGAKSVMGKNLTEMTVNEVVQAQRSGRLFAVGKYQIIPDTMTGFLQKMGISGNAKFDAATQEKFAEYVIRFKRPQVGKYLRGENNNRDEAVQDLAREFASVGLAYPENGKRRGQSRYAGSAGNNASISPDEVAAALDKDRKGGTQLQASSTSSTSQSSPSGARLTGNQNRGGNGKIIEYLTGDRSSPKYRSDHGGGNYHDHIAFDSQSTRDAAISWLRGKGWTIGSINTGSHASNSYHYSNQAFDIPFYPNQSRKGVPDNQSGETTLSSSLRRDLSSGGFTGQSIGGVSGSPGYSGAPAAEVSSPGAEEPQLGQERIGPMIIMMDDYSAQSPAPSPTAAPSPQSIGPSPKDCETNMLNTFIKNKLLLDLAYL